MRAGGEERVYAGNEEEERDVDGEEVGFKHAVEEDKGVCPVDAVFVH